MYTGKQNYLYVLKSKHFFFFFIILFRVLCWHRIRVLWFLLLKMNSHVILVYIVWDMQLSRFTKNYIDAGRYNVQYDPKIVRCGNQWINNVLCAYWNELDISKRFFFFSFPCNRDHCNEIEKSIMWFVVKRWESIMKG